MSPPPPPASKKPGHPHLIFGTATLGMSFTTVSSVAPLLTLLKSHGVAHLDTAVRYPPTSPTASETLLGRANAAKEGFAIDTKIFTAGGDGAGELTSEKVDESVRGSLKRLGIDKVATLYAHRSDPSTPLEEQARAFDAQVRAGRCERIGVSNTPLATLTSLLDITSTLSLHPPRVYQGEYNILTRGAETELLPLLRQHDMTFTAFRPLAAGYLSGSLATSNTAGTRFDPAGPFGKALGTLFGSEHLKSAYAELSQACEEEGGVGTMEVGLRWLVYHSALGEGDGVILGASREEQLVQCLEWVGRGRLSERLLGRVEEVWEGLRESRGGIF